MPAPPFWKLLIDRAQASSSEMTRETNNEGFVWLPMSIGSKYGGEDVPHGAVDDVRLVVGPTSSVSRHARGVRKRVARTDGHWSLDEESSRS